MLGRRRDSLGELVRTQHEETMVYLREHAEETRAWKERRDEEMREFNREILLRNEKVYTTAIAEMEEGRKQIQANTQAVLRMLDRFDGKDDVAA